MSSTAVLEPVLAPPAPVADDEALFEIIDGKRVELPPMSVYAIACRLPNRTRRSSPFDEAHDLGEAGGHEEHFPSASRPGP